MATFKFYADSGLTTPITSSVSIGEGTVDTVLYLGSTDDTKKLQDSTSPGVADMMVDIVDATPGSGPEDTWIRLALSSGGLAGATPGASLNIGKTVYGGSASALPIYIRVENSLSGATSSTDLSIQVSSKEFSV